MKARISVRVASFAGAIAPREHRRLTVWLVMTLIGCVAAMALLAAHATSAEAHSGPHASIVIRVKGPAALTRGTFAYVKPACHSGSKQRVGADGRAIFRRCPLSARTARRSFRASIVPPRRANVVGAARKTVRLRRGSVGRVTFRVTTAARGVNGYTTAPLGCSMNSGGQADQRGIMYVACKDRILRFHEDGRALAPIVLGGAGLADVAPSPDGSLLYVVRRGAMGWPVIRYRRVEGTTYKLTDWEPQGFLMGGVRRPINARNISTDAWGDLYVSNQGRYADGTQAYTRIVKISPDGHVLTAFGEFDIHGEPGTFNLNRGLAASRDGRRLYVTDHLVNRIQRFDLQDDGSYAFKLAFGTFNKDCAVGGGTLAAPSDVGTDGFDNVYVTDTSCHRINKYDADGRFIATIGVGAMDHDIAVDRLGNVALPEWDRRLVRTAANPAPLPFPAITRPTIDTTAPQLREVTVPSPTTTREITVTIDAVDESGEMGKMRFANEDGNWGDWMPFEAQASWTLTDGYGYKGVFVQVSDAAGNISDPLFRQLRYDEPAGDGGGNTGLDTVAPTLNSVTVPATTTTREITVTIDAVDNVAVTHARFATEDGNWSDWQPYSVQMPFTLSDGYGYKGIYVQVRDAAWNISASQYRTLRYEP